MCRSLPIGRYDDIATLDVDVSSEDSFVEVDIAMPNVEKRYAGVVIIVGFPMDSRDKAIATSWF